MQPAATLRPEIPLDPDQREDLIAEAKSAISSHPRVFLSGSRLVEVVQDRERTWIVPLDGIRVRSLLWLCGPWQAWLEENEIHPPPWLPSQLLREESWPDARRLTGITDLPALRPDGSVLTTPGYDGPTGLWYAPGVTVPALPAAPTQADACEAAAELGGVLDAFPVVSKAHRSALLAAMLTPFARFAVQGPSPLFLLDAPGQGLGATQTADMLGRLLCGHQMTRMEKPASERQFRRQIARLKAPADGLILIKGAEELREAASLSTALMDWHWTDGSVEVNRRPRLTWFARSANAELTRATAEGILPIRFFDTDDHVHEASFAWPHPLESWIDATRARFVRASLVLLRAYICAGKPAQPVAPWARYAGWSSFIAGALMWAGMEDPLVARRSLAAAIGDEDAFLRTLVVALAQVCPAGAGLTTQDIVFRKREDGPWVRLRSVLQMMLPGKALDARHVANLLRAHRGVSVEGVFIHRAGSDPLGFARWTVERSPLVAVGLQTLHKHAETPDPETTWFRDARGRAHAQDPGAPVDRVADYPLAGAPAAAESAESVRVAREDPLAVARSKAPVARAESAASVRVTREEPPISAPSKAPVARAESAESVRAKLAMVPAGAARASPAASTESSESLRKLIPDFDAALDKVSARLRANGALGALIADPSAEPRWSGRVGARAKGGGQQGIK